MKISEHPIWLIGFRPFFILAALSGMILPILWALIFNGVTTAPDHLFSSVQWHAHEMFFGFGIAVLGGFLLTASKNWVNIRGFHGRSLILLVFAWVFERVGMFFGGSWPAPLFIISNNLFLGALILMLLWTLIKHHKTDTYKDNIFFIIVLPLFIASKYFLINPEYFKLGTTMANGLFRMAFLLMLERTLTQFMKSIFQVQILRNTTLDITIKITAFLLIFETLIPAQISSWMMLGLALLLSYRFVFWKPQLAFKRIDIGIMYVGYICLVLQLLVEFFSRIFNVLLMGTVSVHIFTFGVMGLIIPAMIIRISNGHTGRKVVFTFKDKIALWSMILAFILRIIATQVFPAQYASLIFAAAVCWLVCFLILAWSYTPFLLRTRIDGKEH